MLVFAGTAKMAPLFALGRILHDVALPIWPGTVNKGSGCDTLAYSE